MSRALQVLTGLLLLVIAWTSSVQAGWVITEVGGQETLISKGKMKSEWDNGRMIIDANNDAIYVIDDTRKMIASGTVDEFCGEIKQMVETMMARVPAEQREMMKKMMGDGKAPEVSIVKKGPGEKVSGFETTRYEVMANGELYEELWVAEDKDMIKDCQPVMKLLSRFTSCTEAISSMGSSASPETSPEYAKIFEMGVIVKSVSHDQEESGDEADIMTVTERDLPEETFVLPDGYKSVPFEAMWTMDEE